MSGFPSILILLAVGLPLVLVAQRLGIGALLAYLITGALAGPHGPLKLVGSDDLHVVAEIGASLLLFSLGLELDLHAMRRRLRSTAVGALGQMGLTIGAGTLLARMLGLDWGPALATGACLSLSSTLLVLRALEERGLRVAQVGAVQRAAEVPVGGVEQAHATTVGRGSDSPGDAARTRTPRADARSPRAAAAGGTAWWPHVRWSATGRATSRPARRTSGRSSGRPARARSR